MSLSTDIHAHYRNRQYTVPNCTLQYRQNKTPAQKRLPDIKPKITAETQPLLKRLQKLEKTCITKKEAEALLDARLSVSEKQNKNQHDALYNKLRGL